MERDVTKILIRETELIIRERTHKFSAFLAFVLERFPDQAESLFQILENGTPREQIPILSPLYLTEKLSDADFFLVIDIFKKLADLARLIGPDASIIANKRIDAQSTRTSRLL
jgi:hypothetical protein